MSQSQASSAMGSVRRMQKKKPWLTVPIQNLHTVLLQLVQLQDVDNWSCCFSQREGFGITHQFTFGGAQGSKWLLLGLPMNWCSPITGNHSRLALPSRYSIWRIAKHLQACRGPGEWKLILLSKASVIIFYHTYDLLISSSISDKYWL